LFKRESLEIKVFPFCLWKGIFGFFYFFNQFFAYLYQIRSISLSPTRNLSEGREECEAEDLCRLVLIYYLEL
jgi:hypothetical protein